MSNRSTSDIVILIFAACIAAVILSSLTVIVVLSIKAPESDLSGVARNIKDITNTLIAAVVGYIAGKWVPPRKPNGNGKSNGNGLP